MELEAARQRSKGRWQCLEAREAEARHARDAEVLEEAQDGAQVLARASGDGLGSLTYSGRRNQGGSSNVASSRPS